MNKLKVTPIQIATVQLAIAGFFFAMRSCKCLKIPQAEQHRRDILRLQIFNSSRMGLNFGMIPPSWKMQIVFQ
jgi:hypothetical protein